MNEKHNGLLRGRECLSLIAVLSARLTVIAYVVSVLIVSVRVLSTGERVYSAATKRKAVCTSAITRKSSLYHGDGRSDGKNDIY